MECLRLEAEAKAKENAEIVVGSLPAVMRSFGILVAASVFGKDV